MCRAAGGLLGGATALPCSGGVGDQPAALSDAFALLESWTANPSSSLGTGKEG